MPADGTSPLPKDFAAPIGRLRHKKAPLVLGQRPRRKSPWNSRLPRQRLRNPKLRPRLLRLRSLRPKKTFRRSNLLQNQKPRLPLLRALLLPPLP
jgi:hypothetical protein